MVTVCIDAGHYGSYNRCPVIPEYYESKMAWKLSQLQGKYFNQLGINVKYTRANLSKDLDLISRGKASKGCDLFISNHSNAVGSAMNESVDYVSVYHLVSDTTTKVDEVSVKYANAVAPVISKLMGVKQGYKVLSSKAGSDRNKDGILNDNYYGVLHGARLVNTPAILIEHSFHTNSKAVKWLLDDSNLDKLARAEVESLASLLLGKSVSLTSSTTQTKSLDVVATEVIQGRWGNGADRKKRLTDAGYNYDEVQALVDKKRGKTTSTTSKKKSVEEIAREVWSGKWGTGNDRKKRLTDAGYNYNAVQAMIKKLYY